MSASPPPPNPSNPRVRIQTTMGDIVVELFQKEAPNTVQNFLAYVKEGFYEGLIFHRVIKGFVVQGGGHTPDMRQKRGRSPIKLELNPALRHWDGALSMARTSDPHSASSQFYICHGAQKGLDDNYAVFGIVREGMDVVNKIATVPTGAGDKPKSDVSITKAAVL